LPSLVTIVYALAFTRKKRYGTAMKFYENLSPEEQKILAYEVAAFNSGMEGMKSTAERLLKQAEEIRNQRSKLTRVLNQSSNPKEQ